MPFKVSRWAACGIVILSLGNAFAQDSNTWGTASTGAGEVSIETTAAAEAPATPRRNYVDQLFGGGANPAVTASEETPAPISTVSAHAPSAQSPNTRVVNAQYTRPSNANTFGQIRQVNGEETAGETFSGSPIGDGNFSTTEAAPQPNATSLASGSSNVPRGPIGPQTPTVSVKWVKKDDINVGQECACDLVVSNDGQTLAANVVVQAFFPTFVRVTGADPAPKTATESLSWTFDVLKPGEKKQIALTLVPSRRGELPTFASVRFTGASSEVFTVEEPLLKLATSGPSEVQLGDPASQMITVSNPGTGVAKNVRVEALLPEGLEHVRGRRLLLDIGSLGPGESRKLRLALTAASGGNQQVKVRTTADGNLQQFSNIDLNVIAPELDVKIAGPKLRYKGRTADFVVTVTNAGTTTSNNVQVMHRIPKGFDFVKANKGGKYSQSGRMISWFVGHLEPGQSAKLNTRLMATELGSFNHQVGAISEHGARSEGTLTTEIEGSASLVLEIVDQADPVEIGTQTAYEIRVRNEGTKAGQNIGLSCELPAAVKLLDAKGPTQFLSENGLLVFKSLPALPPGQTAVYRVFVEGSADGNHRFRARLASDSIQEPLIFEEMTKFYRD